MAARLLPSQEHLMAGVAVAGGVIAASALVRPLAQMFAGDPRLQGAIVFVIGTLVAGMGGAQLRLVGFGIMGQGALQTAAGFGIALPTG